MKLLKPTNLLSAALLSLVVTAPYLPSARPKPEPFDFEVTVASSTSGFVQVYYDVGRGLSEADSVRLAIEGNRKAHRLIFALPEGEYRALRFDPIDREGSIRFGEALIRGPDGRVVRSFAPADFVVQQQIGRCEIANGQVEITTTPGADDPNMNIRIGRPFRLRPSLGFNLRTDAARFPFVFCAILAVGAAAGRWGGFGRSLWAWLSSHPGKAVALAAAVSVVASSYPVIFAGKSIVSPNYGVVLLYDGFPTLPGDTDSQPESGGLADVGAILWQQVPMSMVERHALVADRDLPFWNRYNSGGNILMGQGQSMFGDPLNLPALLANGAAWAWDLEFLIAKWLLACGMGLIVLRVSRHLPSALLVAAAADFVGFFVYRVNHPAIFSFCCAPWILYGWVRMATATDRRGADGWTLGLVALNAIEMTSGTVKEAYVLMFTLNFAGALGLALVSIPPMEKLRRLGLAVAGGVLLVLISAPLWLTFKDALHVSNTIYDDPRAFQIQPSLLIGLFDEIFYRPFCVQEGVYNPSTNMLFLVGLLACLVNVRALATNKLVFAFGLASLVPLSLAFGLVPPQWIVRIPYAAGLSQIDSFFSDGLILLVEILAGWGFAVAATRPAPYRRGDFAVCALLLFALVLPYVAYPQVVQRSSYIYLSWGETLPRSPFVWGSLAVLLSAAFGFMVAASRILSRGPNFARILVALACVFAMLWRHGWHTGIGFKDYVVNVPSRVDFTAKSPAVSAVQAQVAVEPGRVVGTENNLFPGWNDVYRLEGLGGPDALRNPHYLELLKACQVDETWGWRYLVHFETLRQLKPLYDFLDVRYYLDYKAGRGRMASFLTPILMADLDVYRSESAWPRAFFTDRLAVYGTAADLAGMVMTGDGRPFAAIQSGEAGGPADLPGSLLGRTVRPARNYRLTTNTTEFEIDATTPGVAVLNESWFEKDFLATLDGRPVPYFRINHAFKGVRVPSAGTHRIRFTYRPHHFTAALRMFWSGAALFALGGVWVWRGGRNRTDPRRGRSMMRHVWPLRNEPPSSP